MSMYDAVMKAMEAILKAPWTKSMTFGQYIAQPSISTQNIYTDDELMLKGKFDFLDNCDRIVDLKCTGSVAMVKKELLWNGHLNLNHKWVRQMSIYRHLLLESSKGNASADVVLAIVGHDGSCWFLRLDPDSMDIAFRNVLRDIAHLRNAIDTGTYIETYTHYVKNDTDALPVATETYTF